MASLSKRLIHYLDIIISLLQVIMVLPPFSRELQRTYEKDVGGRLGKGGPYQVDYLVHNSGNGVGSNPRIELKKISRASKEVP